MVNYARICLTVDCNVNISCSTRVDCSCYCSVLISFDINIINYNIRLLLFSHFKCCGCSIICIEYVAAGVVGIYCVVSGCKIPYLPVYSAIDYLQCHVHGIVESNCNVASCISIDCYLNVCDITVCD